MRRRGGPAVEQFVILLSFSILALTGLPQKYLASAWAQRLIGVFGGIQTTRLIHRTLAVILIAQGVYHLVTVVAGRKRAVRRRDMHFSLADVRDLIGDAMFLASRRRERPRLGRFDYRQKFEYWAVVWGTTLMAVTGLIMWFPIIVTRWLPGVVIPASRVVHGGEALLALFAVITWHLCNAHFRPDIFPESPTETRGPVG